MKSLVERCGNIWESMRQSPAQRPSRVDIPRSHVDEGQKMGIDFKPFEHYFQVRVNEMYLPYERKWFSTYDPMVFVVSEFKYGKEDEAVPFVVGPMMMEQYGQKMPAGMIFSDTRVAGLHPYQGGRLALSVVLYRVRQTNYAKKLLQVVESAASVLDFATALSTYTKIASVVLDGVEALLGLGDTDPLIGFRCEFDPDAGDKFEPSYFALINTPEDDLDTDKLWVRKRKLLYGNSLAKAKPFRDADFVLYSTAQTAKRSDLTTLSFYPAYERMIDAAMKSNTEDSWRLTKALMTDLAQTLRFSPDLTPEHAADLRSEYISEMVKEHERSVDVSNLGASEDVDSEFKDIVGILDL